MTPITRSRIYDQSFALIGDSTGVGISVGANTPLPALLNGVFTGAAFDALTCRRTTGSNCAAPFDDNGLAAAARLATPTDVAIVVLGYNDDVLTRARIDEMLAALVSRGVSRVGWVNLSERSASGGARFAASNAALGEAAGRWQQLRVLDWRSASAGPEARRWFNSDGIHLTNTGNAEFASFLRQQLFAMIEGGSGPAKVSPTQPLRVPLAELRPHGTTGVALNVTVVDPEGPGFATVWPCDAPSRPGTSNINFVASVPGRNPTVEPNAVMMALGGSSEVCVHVSERAHVLVDVSGWLGTGFDALLEPLRIVDTRNGIGAPRQRVAAGSFISVDLGAAPPSASSAVMNVTAVGPGGGGFLTVWPCSEPRPNTSNVNYAAGSGAEPNLVIAQLDTQRSVCVFSDQTVDVLVDVMGYLSDGFVPIVPDRVADTRTGIGGRSGRIVSGEPLELAFADAGPSAGAVAVAMNVTAVAPSGAGFLTVWPCSEPRPNTSNINFTSPGAGVAEPNLVAASVAGDRRVCVHSEAPSFVLVDVAGFFRDGFTPIVPRRVMDTRHDSR